MATVTRDLRLPQASSSQLTSVVPGQLPVRTERAVSYEPVQVSTTHAPLRAGMYEYQTSGVLEEAAQEAVPSTVAPTVVPLEGTPSQSETAEEQPSLPCGQETAAQVVPLPC